MPKKTNDNTPNRDEGLLTRVDAAVSELSTIGVGADTPDDATLAAETGEGAATAVSSERKSNMTEKTNITGNIKCVENSKNILQSGSPPKMNSHGLIRSML